MITLYQFPGIWGLPNASPFCLKIETYLRMAEIPYEIRFLRDPRKSPKGKLPFIKIDDKLIPDSEIIIDYLKGKFGDVLDKNLNTEQKALSALLDDVFSERLYWIMLYMRWQVDAVWPPFARYFFWGITVFKNYFCRKLYEKRCRKLYIFKVLVDTVMMKYYKWDIKHWMH
ncbi:Tom37 metaxin N-terminal-like domain-containing protein [Legionella tunisiensis]|uniref:Tom37 metaxin N-terminal-like domain-containing protein n=1 Tax=Legionella tunisiensis TaxID=1034944 RepID=UPI00030BC636|nr:Tom37 metaxin N-terminal-like domain-containing protein [Legionella tunisiensis]